jgi:DNA-directed RNA polymerase specialized sigma24 family protein
MTAETPAAHVVTRGGRSIGRALALADAAMTLATPRSRAAALLSDPTLRARIVCVVRKRVADDDAVEDIVQEALTDAYAYETRLPAEDSAAKKYLFGIVRNKIRMHIREWVAKTHDSFDEEVHGKVDPAPVEARELVQKIVAGVPPSRWETFTWFVRVTFGDSLAEIAREAGVEYDTAHKRIERMRDDLRRRANELTTMAAIVLLAFGILRTVRARPDPTATPDLRPQPSYVVHNEPTQKAQTAAELRRTALAACDAARWAECLERLDEARRLDAPGDATPDVQAARSAARKGLEQTPEPPSRDVK